MIKSAQDLQTNLLLSASNVLQILSWHIWAFFYTCKLYFKLKNIRLNFIIDWSTDQLAGDKIPLVYKEWELCIAYKLLWVKASPKCTHLSRYSSLILSVQYGGLCEKQDLLKYLVCGWASVRVRINVKNCGHWQHPADVWAALSDSPDKVSWRETVALPPGQCCAS